MRLKRSTAVLAGLVAAGLLAGATRTPWVQASAPDLAGTAQQVSVTGSDAAPAVLALALAGLAAALATSLSSAWVRFLTGPVMVLAGVAAAVASLGAVRDPAAAARGAVVEATGVSGGEIAADATAWPLIALVPASALALVGVLVLVAGRAWPVGTRYRSAAVAATADPADDPAAAWDALSRGEDPSVAGEDHDEGSDGRPDAPTGEDPKH